jgi:hypothetical protein
MEKETQKIEVEIRATKIIKLTIPKEIANNEKAIATIVNAKMLKSNKPVKWKITDIWEDSKEDTMQAITKYYE